jgi:hypothetical protein
MKINLGSIQNIGRYILLRWILRKQVSTIGKKKQIYFVKMDEWFEPIILTI